MMSVFFVRVHVVSFDFYQNNLISCLSKYYGLGDDCRTHSPEEMPGKKVEIAGRGDEEDDLEP